MAKKILAFIVAHLHPWGYAIIFIVTVLEASAFLGLFVPGDTVVIIAGFLAFRRLLKLPVALAIASLGAAIGDSIGYFIGRRYGEGFLLRHGRRFHIRRPQLDAAKRFLDRHGGPALVIGRFAAYIRTFVPVMAGISKMPYPKFVLFNVIGGILWAAAYMAVGYFFGEGWERAGKILGAAWGAILAVVVIVVVIVMIVRRKRRRRGRK